MFQLLFDRRRVSHRGFTLVELVLVIALLGILAIAAVPQFVTVTTTTAATNAKNAVVSAVNTALSDDAASDVAAGGAVSYPASLDAHADATVASQAAPLFNAILKGGVTNGWTKISTTCYRVDNVSPTEKYKYTVSTGIFALDNTCT